LIVTKSGASRADISDEYTIPRQRMVERLHEHYKIEDARVLAVMEKLPRHLFVPPALQAQA